MTAPARPTRFGCLVMIIFFPLQDEKYIATEDYEAQNEDEIGYERGAVVTVLQKKLDGWWRVSHQCCAFVVPLLCVSV